MYSLCYKIDFNFENSFNLINQNKIKKKKKNKNLHHDWNHIFIKNKHIIFLNNYLNK